MRVNKLLYRLYEKENSNENDTGNPAILILREKFKKGALALLKRNLGNSFDNFFIISRKHLKKLYVCRDYIEYPVGLQTLNLSVSDKIDIIGLIQNAIDTISQYGVFSEEIGNINELMCVTISELLKGITNKSNFNKLFLSFLNIQNEFISLSQAHEHDIENELNPLDLNEEDSRSSDIIKYVNRNYVDDELLYGLLSQLSEFKTIESDKRANYSLLVDAINNQEYNGLQVKMSDFLGGIDHYIDSSLVALIKRQIGNLQNYPNVKKLLISNLETLLQAMNGALVRCFIRNQGNTLSMERFQRLKGLFSTYKELLLVIEYCNTENPEKSELLSIEQYNKELFEVLEKVNFNIDKKNIDTVILTRIEKLFKVQKTEIVKKEKVEKRKNMIENAYDFVKSKFEFVFEKIQALLSLAFIILMTLLGLIKKGAEKGLENVDPRPAFKKGTNAFKNSGFAKKSSGAISRAKKGIAEKANPKDLLDNAGFANSLKDMEMFTHFSKGHDFDKNSNFEKHSISGFEILNYERLDSKLLIGEIFYRFENDDWEKEVIDFNNSHTLDRSGSAKQDYSIFLDEFNWKIDDSPFSIPVMKIRPGVLKKGKNPIVVPRGYIPVITEQTKKTLEGVGIDFELYCIKDKGYFYIDLSKNVNLDFAIEFIRYGDKEYNGIFFNRNHPKQNALLSKMIDHENLTDELKDLLSEIEEMDISEQLERISSYLSNNFLYSTAMHDTVEKYNTFSGYIEGIANTRVGDCKNINSLNIAIARMLGVPSQELAGFVKKTDKNDKVTYGGHGVTEVNMGGKSKLYDATPSSKKDSKKDNKFSMPDLPSFSLKDMDFKGYWKKLEQYTLTLSVKFVERSAIRKLERSKLFLIYDRRHRMLPIHYEMSRLPDITKLKEKISPAEYRNQVMKYHMAILALERINSYGGGIESSLINEQYVNNLMRIKKAFQALSFLCGKDIISEDFYYEVFKLIQSSDNEDSKGSFLKVVKILFPKLDILLLEKQIEELGLEWIYDAIINIEELKSSNYVDYCFFPRITQDEIENNINGSYSSSYEEFDEHDHNKKTQEGYKEINENFLPLFEKKTTKKGILLKEMYQSLINEIKTNGYKIDIDMDCGILNARMRIIRRILETYFEGDSFNNFDKLSNSYISSYGNDAFIKKVQFLFIENRTATDYYDLLSNESFYNDPDNLLFLSKIIEDDLLSAESNKASRVSYYQDFGMTNRQSLSFADEDGDEKDEYNQLNELSASLRKLLLEMSKNNPRFMIKVHGGGIKSNTEREIVLDSLGKIKSKELDDYELGLDLIIDDEERSRRSSYFGGISNQTYAQGAGVVQNPQATGHDIDTVNQLPSMRKPNGSLNFPNHVLGRKGNKPKPIGYIDRIMYQNDIPKNTTLSDVPRRILKKYYKNLKKRDNNRDDLSNTEVDAIRRRMYYLEDNVFVPYW